MGRLQPVKSEPDLASIPIARGEVRARGGRGPPISTDHRLRVKQGRDQCQGDGKRHQPAAILVGHAHSSTSGRVALGSSGMSAMRPGTRPVATVSSMACDIASTGHLKGGFDRVFEIVRVVGRRFVSLAEVHSIRAGAHLAQSQPEMAGDRFGFLERHGFMKIVIGEHEQGVGKRPVDTRSLLESGS
jgi:hypothetical protein